MIKIAQKHIKIKATSLKYLYEMAAIPVETRQQFLQKLLKRKNASEQKNVRLLKIIYECINEGEMLSWDEEEICNKLDISKGMLYCHKSYLLKGLRMLYFNWKEIEKIEFKDTSKYKDEIELILACGKRMLNIGMKKEAQNLFFQIEKLINKKLRKTNDDYVILFKALKYSCTYYYRKKNKKKFNTYYKKIIKLGNQILKFKHKVRSYILVNLYILEAQKIKFYADKTTVVYESIKLQKLALIESQKIKDLKQESTILYNISNTYMVIGNFKESIKYAKLGLILGKRRKAPDIYYAFKSAVYILDYITGKINPEEINTKVNEIINNLHYSDNSVVFKQITLKNIVELSSNIGNDKNFNNSIYEYTSREIIYDGLNPSIIALYYMKWHNYLKNIKQISIGKDLTNKKYLTVKEAQTKYIRKFDNSIMEFTVHTGKLRNIVFKRQFYLSMLLADFWKGRSCSIEYSNHIYRQLEWITRTRVELYNSTKELADDIYLGINIMSESRNLNPDELLDKYRQKFKNYADRIAQAYKKNNDLGLDGYYMLSFVAEQSQCEELKLIAKKTFVELEKIHSEYIKTQIEEIERKIREETLNISNQLETKAA